MNIKKHLKLIKASVKAIELLIKEGSLSSTKQKPIKHSKRTFRGAFVDAAGEKTRSIDLTAGVVATYKPGKLFTTTHIAKVLHKLNKHIPFTKVKNCVSSNLTVLSRKGRAAIIGKKGKQIVYTNPVAANDKEELAFA